MRYDYSCCCALAAFGIVNICNLLLLRKPLVLMFLRIHSCCYVRYLQQKLPRNTRQVSGKYFIIYWIKYFKIGLKIGLKILWDDIFIIMFYLEVSHIEILEITWTNHCVKSVRIRSYSGPYFPRIFPHSKWIRIDTEYLSAFSPNAGKCGKNEDQNNYEYGQFLRSDPYPLL